MRKKYMRIALAGVVVGALLASVVVVLAGDLDSPGAPDATDSYTLQDIYNRLHDGTQGSPSTFTEPATGPMAGSGHTLDEIMAQAPARDNTNGASAAQVLAGWTFWGLRTSGGTWGTQTGSITVRNGYSASTAQVLFASKIYFNVPEGYYDGDDWVSATNAQVAALDTNITAGNIKKGVSILGQVGTLTPDGGTAVAADLLDGKTAHLTNDWNLDTGTLHGGCTCSGTLNGTRWCDNGDGTVTDLTTCLVWLKKADWGGIKQWRQTGDYNECDDAHTRAGLLKAGADGADLSDGSTLGAWRLPTKAELNSLANGPEGVSSENMRAFTGVQSGGGANSGYWSSTTTIADERAAWYVELADGTWYHIAKNFFHDVWPVRGGQ